MIQKNLQGNEEDDLTVTDGCGDEGDVSTANKKRQGIGGDDAVPDGNGDGDVRGKGFSRVKLEKAPSANMFFVLPTDPNRTSRGIVPYVWYFCGRLTNHSNRLYIVSRGL